MTLTERMAKRVFLTPGRYAIYEGTAHDLYISLPDYSRLQRNFQIVFDKKAEVVPVIKFRNVEYPLTTCPTDRGYLCIYGRFGNSKGLHKIPLHRLAYVAFYGQPPAGYHIHHIDHNKQNNAADNLVALTEEEHSLVHNRDVRVVNNLFRTPDKKTTLIDRAAKQKELAVKQFSKLLQEDLIQCKQFELAQTIDDKYTIVVNLRNKLNEIFS